MAPTLATRTLVHGGPRRTWRWYANMVLINVAEFAAESSRGIVLPTLFLYNQSLGGDLASMGLLTSVFSVGRLISSTVFGWMCDRYSFKFVYTVSSLVCLVGNAIYMLADASVTNSIAVLVVSRFLVGFGAGNRSVCRANVAALTTVDQRLRFLTILAAVVFLGYALTPGLGSLVAGTDFEIAGVYFNKYTSPGAILVALNLVTILAMAIVFDESITVDDGPKETPKRISGDIIDSPTEAIALSDRAVKIGALVFIFLNFTARGVLSVFETVNIPLFLKVTNGDAKSLEAVVAASNFHFYLGLLGLVTYFSIDIFRNKMSDIQWVHLGFFTLLVGNIMLVVLPSEVTFVRLVVAETFVWSVGCPITTAVVVAAFSRLLGDRPQGTLMGLLGSAASVSRIVLPLLPAAMASMTDVFWFNIALCLVCVGSLICYQRFAFRVATVEDRDLDLEKATSEKVDATDSDSGHNTDSEDGGNTVV
jgi:MFS transporter, ceroid-lipofuscinosis neuronal protein 7